jgi:hypothetical protein
MILQRILFTIVLGLPLLSGCAGLNNFYELAAFRMGSHHDLADIRRDTREQLAEERLEAKQIAAERELQQLQVDLERQKLEMQFCQANIAAQQQQLASQIRDNLQSKVAFNVEQGLEVGELEVDVEQLQQLLKQRKKDAAAPTLSQNASQKSTCGFEERLCGCEPGLRRKHCLRCAHQKCGCPPENDCGGPAALQQAQTSPQRSLRPQEIPMKLPVRLTFGMQNPRIEEARILRRPPPYTQPQLQQKGPQQKSEGCEPCQKGNCALHHHFTSTELPPPPVPAET